MTIIVDHVNEKFCSLCAYLFMGEIIWQQFNSNNVFSFEAMYRCISLVINFPNMGLMFINKLSFLFYNKSVILSFTGMYSRSEWKQIIVFELGYDLILISYMKMRCESSRWPMFLYYLLVPGCFAPITCSPQKVSRFVPLNRYYWCIMRRILPRFFIL